MAINYVVLAECGREGRFKGLLKIPVKSIMFLAAKPNTDGTHELNYLGANNTEIGTYVLDPSEHKLCIKDCPQMGTRKKLPYNLKRQVVGPYTLLLKNIAFLHTKVVTATPQSLVGSSTGNNVKDDYPGQFVTIPLGQVTILGRDNPNEDDHYFVIVKTVGKNVTWEFLDFIII